MGKAKLLAQFIFLLETNRFIFVINATKPYESDVRCWVNQSVSQSLSVSAYFTDMFLASEDT